MKAQPLSEYHEDMGAVLWWKFPVNEPPYVGSPNDAGRVVALQIIGASEPFQQCTFMVGGWPGYHTHWTPLPETPEEP